MGRDTLAKLVTVLLGLLMFAAALVLMGLEQGDAQGRPDMPYRVYAPMVAKSSAPIPTVTPTAVPTATPTPTSTPTATPTSPSAPTATPTPTPTAEPSYYIEWYAFCSTDPTCPNGSEALYVGEYVYFAFVVNPGPKQVVTAKVYWNGGFMWDYPWTEVPYADNTVLITLHPGVGLAPATGTLAVDVYVGSDYIGSFSAEVQTRSGGGGGGGLTFASIDGRAILVADDGTYLGVVSSNQYASESICNEYGTYGSPYSSTSVRNEYSQYGSPYATLSAYNPYTSTPPAIMMDGQIVGYLTKNEYHQGAVDPDAIFAYYGCTY